MPGYKFGDSENRVFETVAKGDYILEVVGVEFGLSEGPKTRGSDTATLRVRVDGREAPFDERLTFHPSCEWKIDTFIKSVNLLVDGKPPAKGQQIEFTDRMLLGLRGWATVGVKQGIKDPTKQFNEVVTWLTNKEKLVKRAVELPPEEPEDDIPF